MVKCFWPSDVSTVTVLAIVPDLPRKSRSTSIGPPAPGAMFQGWLGSFATVQPHEVRVPFTTTLAGEMFVRKKEKWAFVSFGLAL